MSGWAAVGRTKVRPYVDVRLRPSSFVIRHSSIRYAQPDVVPQLAHL